VPFAQADLIDTDVLDYSLRINVLGFGIADAILDDSSTVSAEMPNCLLRPQACS